MAHGKYPERGIIPLPYHHSMLSDVIRCQAFFSAIERVVQPGDVVLDVGSGTGILGYFAVQQGARRVYAVEADPHVALAARQYVQLNHLEDHIQVVQGLAQDFTPPEETDVVICEMLHVGLIVEPQVPVLNALRSTLNRTQPNRPYRVIPSEVVNYCQLVNEQSDFYGYRVPMVRFGNTYAADPSLTVLSELVQYAHVSLSAMVDPSLDTAVDVPATVAGTVNAIRMLTQAVLWIDETQPPGHQLIDWFLYFLVVPLEHEIPVTVGQAVKVSVTCTWGSPLEELQVRAHS
jgi:hypothetical protein